MALFYRPSCNLCCAFSACLILLNTHSMEDNELFTTKLGHRWFTFALMVITAHLWARGSSWKLTSLKIIGIIAAFYVDTSEPHPAALGILLQFSISLAVIIMSFNRSKLETTSIALGKWVRNWLKLPKEFLTFQVLEALQLLLCMNFSEPYLSY